MADLTAGAIFAGHRIEGIAGRGGMGTVYRATHLALDHVVALKVISGELAADAGFRARFRSESRVAVSLRHPNVVTIHHAGEEDGLPFVTMDLIDGPDLRRLLLASGPLQPARAAGLIGQVAAALDVAHSRGLVHRDIKPGNVLVEQRADGFNSEHAYLTDFGLAKRFDQATDVSGLTGTGAFVGTLDYVAPEQIRGDRVDARTDVYALGCVLYETMAGRPPFGEREENVAKIYAHLQDEPPWLPGDVDGKLDAVVARAMAKEPRDRFPSAGDLARAASAAASGVVSRVDERSVAVGRAAPQTPVETRESPGASPPAETVESAPSVAAETTTATAATAPTVPARLKPPATTRGNGPPRGLLLVGGIGALIVIVALLTTFGSGQGAPDVATSGGGGGSPAAAAPAEYRNPIPVGGFPVGLSIHDNEVSTAARAGARLLNVDKRARETVTSTELPGQGEDVAVIGRFAWVTMPLEDAVAKVSLDYGDPETYAAVETIPVGDEPRGIVAADASLWVANLGSSEISRIDADTDEVTPIPLDPGAEPTDIAFDETALWVTDRAGDQVIRRDIEGDGEEGFPVGDNPKGVVIFEEQVWVANADGGDVSRLGLDGEPTGEPIDVDGTPRGIASGFGSVWVANGGEQDEQGYVSAIDPAGGKPQRVDLAGSPEEIAAGPKLMWVTTGAGNSLASIDPDPTDDEP